MRNREADKAVEALLEAMYMLQAKLKVLMDVGEYWDDSNGCMDEPWPEEVAACEIARYMIKTGSGWASEEAGDHMTLRRFLAKLEDELKTVIMARDAEIHREIEIVRGLSEAEVAE